MNRYGAAMSGWLEVDFEGTVNGYSDRLNTDLRGFRAAADGLDTWVHDENPARSALSMVESCHVGGLTGVELLFRATDLDRPWLERQAARYGKVTVAHEPYRLRVAFGSPDAAFDVEVAAPTDMRRRPQEAGEVATPAAIAETYRVALATWSLNANFQADIAGANVWRTADETLALRVVDGFVTEARWWGCSGEDAALREALCATIEGVPLSDAAWFGAIRLEHALRDPDLPRPQPGITHADNTDPRFGELGRALREVLAEWEVRNGAVDRFEGWLAAPGAAWTALDNTQRREAIQQNWERVASGWGQVVDALVAIDVERDYRVILDLSAADVRSRQALMMQFERELNRLLDPALRVYQVERGDKNRLRRL